jgi:hypothetical protein
VYNFVQLGPSPYCQANNLHAKYIWTNIDASSFKGVVDKLMTGLEPLRVEERNAKPTMNDQGLAKTEDHFKKIVIIPRTTAVNVYTKYPELFSFTKDKNSGDKK